MWIHTSSGEQSGQLPELVLEETRHHGLPGRNLGFSFLQGGGGQAKVLGAGRGRGDGRRENGEGMEVMEGG